MMNHNQLVELLAKKKGVLSWEWSVIVISFYFLLFVLFLFFAIASIKKKPPYYYKMTEDKIMSSLLWKKLEGKRIFWLNNNLNVHSVLSPQNVSACRFMGKEWQRKCFVFQLEFPAWFSSSIFQLYECSQLIVSLQLRTRHFCKFHKYSNFSCNY